MGGNQMETIQKVLMERDGLTAEEAEKSVQEGKEELLERLGDGDMPFDFCEEMWGLEPDYLEQLIM